MEFITPELIAQLGFSAVFLVFIIMLWQKLNKKDEENEAIRVNKDNRIRELTDNLSIKYEENTRVNEGMKNVLQNNTDVMNRVLERFDEVMRNGKK